MILLAEIRVEPGDGFDYADACDTIRAAIDDASVKGCFVLCEDVTASAEEGRKETQ